MISYFGSQKDLHLPNSITSMYQTDRSNSKRYMFNEFGFRSSSMEKYHGYRVYVCGCSYTFGVGLDVEETWPYVLCQRLQEMLHCSVSLWNFSQGGASNDYIVKTLLQQAQHQKPDLIIPMYTYKNRAEFNSSRIYSEMIGRWNDRWYSTSHYKGWTPEDAFIRTLKNMLLMEWFCRVSQINYFASWIEHQALQDVCHLAHPSCKVFISMLDMKYISRYGINDPSICQDIAADGSHPEPLSNAKIAELLYDEIKSHGIL